MINKTKLPSLTSASSDYLTLYDIFPACKSKEFDRIKILVAIFSSGSSYAAGLFIILVSSLRFIPHVADWNFVDLGEKERRTRYRQWLSSRRYIQSNRNCIVPIALFYSDNDLHDEGDIRKQMKIDNVFNNCLIFSRT